MPGSLAEQTGQKGFIEMNKLNNSIQVIQTNKPHIFNIKLSIRGKSKNIGILDESNDGTFIAIRKEKHLFRKNHSLGINYELLTAGHIHFKWILIDYCNRRLVSTRNYFLKKGKALNFTKQGFELQIFVPIAEMNIHTARQFELQQAQMKKSVPDSDLFSKPV